MQNKINVYIIFLLWIYLDFITQLIGIVIPKSIAYLLKYIILAIMCLYLIYYNHFKFSKKIIYFSFVYFLILILNLLLVSYPKFVFIEASTAYLTFFPIFYIMTFKEFRLQELFTYWYKLVKYIVLLSIFVVFLYKFGLVKYSIFNTYLLITILFLSFYYNYSDKRNKHDLVYILFLLFLQVVFGGRMAGITSLFIIFYTFVFLRKMSLQKRILLLVVLLLIGSVIFLNLSLIINIIIKTFNFFGLNTRTFDLLNEQLQKGSLFENFYVTNRDFIYGVTMDFLDKQHGLPGGFAVIRNLTNGEYYHAHNLFLNMFCVFGFYGTIIILVILIYRIFALKRKSSSVLIKRFTVYLIFVYLIISLVDTYFINSSISILIIGILFFMSFEKEQKLTDNINEMR